MILFSDRNAAAINSVKMKEGKSEICIVITDQKSNPSFIAHFFVDLCLHNRLTDQFLSETRYLTSTCPMSDFWSMFLIICILVIKPMRQSCSHRSDNDKCVYFWYDLCMTFLDKTNPIQPIFGKPHFTQSIGNNFLNVSFMRFPCAAALL